MAAKKNLTGFKINYLTILSEAEPVLISKKYRTAWNCLCECGNLTTVLTCNLTKTKNPTRSCGCYQKNKIKYNFEDLSNQNFGNLKVIERDGFTKTRGALWKCKCVCGEIDHFSTNALKLGNNVRCRYGKHEEIDYKKTHIGEIHLQHINAIKQNAIKRELVYTVSNEYLWNLFLEQKRKCKITGLELNFTQKMNGAVFRYETTASLDRIDSDLGYIEGNVRWVHKDVNKMLNNYGDEKYLNYCRLSHLYQYQPNDLEIKRPNWNEYFLILAKDISLRSDDPNIKHGSVITTLENNIIGTGFNGTIPNTTINDINYFNRDIKRREMIHSEENAILNCLINPKNIHGAKIYITGKPCPPCLMRIINFGITEVHYADCIGTITDSNEDELQRENLINRSKIKIFKYPINTFWMNKNYY